jgi:PAS domain S-box-containing protein
MANPAIFSRRAVRYAFAVAAVGAAAGLAQVDGGGRDRAPVLLAAAAVTVASWVGGLGPGLLATALAAALLAWFVLPPLGGLGLGEGSAEDLGLFLVVALLTVVLNEVRRRTEAERGRLLTAERSAREVIEAAEARFRRLFDGAADAVVVVDAAGRIAEANPAATRLLGYAPDAFRSLAFGSGTLSALEPAEAAAAWARLQREGRWRGETALRRKDGSSAPVEAAAAAIDLADGTAWLVTWRDVSERRAALREQVSLLAGLAHDLRTPLTAVRGRAQLLRRRFNRHEEVDLATIPDGLTAIEQAADRMGRLLDQLADLAKLRLAQPLDLARGPVDLRSLAESVAPGHQPLHLNRRVAVVVEGTPPVGRWDATRLERVVGNLIGNALKDSPSGGDVTVRIGSTEGWATLAVADRGIGIPTGDLTRVFEPFRRAANAGSIEGTGVGLASTKQIIDQHGGVISISSTEGDGTTVFVRLPVGEP